MPSQIEVLLVAKDAGMTLAFNKAGRSAGEMAQAIDKASKIIEQASTAGDKWETTANRMDKAGRNARIGLSSFNEIAGMLGVNLSGITGPAASAADAIGDLAGSMEGFSRAQFAALGVIGILAAGFVALNSAMMARNDEIAKGILKNDAWVVSMGNFAKGNAEATASLQEFARLMAQVQTGWSWDLGDVVDRWMQFDMVGRGAAEALDLLGIKLGDLHPALKTSAERAEELKDKLSKLAAESDAAAAAASRLAEHWKEANEALMKYASFVTQESANERRWGDYNKRVAQSLHETESSMLKNGQTLDQFSDKTKKAEEAAKRFAEQGLEKMRAAAERARAAFQAMVEKALTPTKADPDLGETWDENRKRLEAVATGTDPSIYGEEFKKMFDELGMSAEEAARKFKDFSLFLNPDNFKFVKWEAVTADVEAQLLSMAGKAALTAEAIRRVWAGLSDTAKASLAEQGIGNTEDAIKQLLDPAGAAKEKVNELGAAITSIPTAVVTTFTADIEKAKAAVQELADFLQRFVNAYGTITVSANGNFSGPPPPPNGSGNNGYPWVPPTGAPPQPQYNPLPSATTMNDNRVVFGNVGMGFPNVKTAADAEAIYEGFVRKLGQRANLRQAGGF